MSNGTSKGWNIGLWVLQVLLGLAFGAVGFMKLATPIDELVKMGMTWAAELPFLARFIGASELLGGIGLILPAATRIKPILTPIAAALLAVVMVLAVGYHVVIEGKPETSGGAFVLGVLSALVAWGRLSKAPIRPR
jgi:putative oxidoreductase